MVKRSKVTKIKVKAQKVKGQRLQGQKYTKVKSQRSGHNDHMSKRPKVKSKKGQRSRTKGNKELHNYETHNSSLLEIPRANSTKLCNTLSYQGAKCWNSLPNVLKESSNLVGFKQLLKEFIKENVNNEEVLFA